MDPTSTDCTAIDYSQTGFFSKIILDYLSGAPALAPFYQYRPGPEAFAEAIRKKKAANTDRAVLAEVLLSQYGPELLSGPVKENIESLRSPDTFTVTTGHQLNIFGGPLYFVYKLITTINLAEAVEKTNPGSRVVPVYWMATEDHDFAEIDHVHLFGKTVRWQHTAGGATGKLDPRSLGAALEEVETILGKGEHAGELATLFREAYLGRETLAEATRYFVHRLLGDYGLLVIDGDDPRLKSLFSGIMKEDISGELSGREVRETDLRLSEAGYPSQAHPREINFFYLEDGLRERIVREKDEYRVMNTDIRFSRQELEGTIDKHPERFSPNVLMRPLYQELLLPNLAYVGGGGELAYWMQLLSTFRAHRIDFPLLVLRNSALLVDGNSRKKMSNLDVAPEQLFQPEQELVSRYVAERSGDAPGLEGEKEDFERIFEKIAAKVAAVDPTLKDSAEAEKTRLLHSLKGLEQKLARAGKRKFDTEIAQLARLREKLFPGNGLQERHDNFMSVYLREGPAFFRLLKKHFDPFLNKFLIFDVR